jgi:hypothetical protein
MPIVKKRNEQTETRLLLESNEPVELPPAEVAEGAVVLQFDTFRQYIPELLEALRAGTVAEPVPVMLDGSTFVVHGATRSFWVKLWHAARTELARIERVQVISCLPSTRGLQVIVDDPDDFDDEGEGELGEDEDDLVGDAGDSEDDGEGEDEDEDELPR